MTERSGNKDDMRRVTPARIAAAISLLAPIAGVFWVGSYNRITPRLGGIPFFYWYQLLWVLLTMVLMVLAQVLIRRRKR